MDPLSNLTDEEGRVLACLAQRYEHQKLVSTLDAVSDAIGVSSERAFLLLKALEGLDVVRVERSGDFMLVKLQPRCTLVYREYLKRQAEQPDFGEVISKRVRSHPLIASFVAVTLAAAVIVPLANSLWDLIARIMDQNAPPSPP